MTDTSIARYIWLFYSIGTFDVIRLLGSQYKLQRIGILARKLKEILTAVTAFSFKVYKQCDLIKILHQRVLDVHFDFIRNNSELIYLRFEFYLEVFRLNIRFSLFMENRRQLIHLNLLKLQTKFEGDLLRRVYFA